MEQMEVRRLKEAKTFALESHLVQTSEQETPNSINVNCNETISDNTDPTY